MPSLVRQSPAPDKGGVAPFLPTRAQEEATGQKRLLTQWERSLGAEIIPHVPGTPLPNVEKAVFVPAKLTAYSLNPAHPSGGSKARVWKSSIGATLEDAATIERQVMAMLPYAEAIKKDDGTDVSGQRFNVYVPVTGPNGKTVDVLTGWIYDRDRREGSSISTRPRLITIYVPEKNRAF